MTAIEICALEKVFHVGFWRKREKRALHPLTLSVEQGEVFGYLGANGAGKTTTLKLLMGLITPTGGTARILGVEIGDQRSKTQIGYLPEQPYFYDHLSAPELLEYYAQLSGIPGRERRARVTEMLGRVGLADVGSKQLRKFSKGMLQRVGIAQAILHDPQVVFLDEPMSGLDPMGRREVRELIEELKNAGKTIFFSTHILSDAETLCDRVAVLHKGELRAIGAVAELTSELTGNVDIVWQGSGAVGGVSALGVPCHITGEIVRVTVEDSNTERVLAAVRKAHGKLISVTPVRTTLEEYFVQQVTEPAPEPELSLATGDGQ
jgi:ABC-2 type transport system ATP-binding protein